MISETGFTPDQEARYQAMADLRPGTTREEFRDWLRRNPSVGDPMPTEGLDLWARFIVQGQVVTVALMSGRAQPIENDRALMRVESERRFNIYSNGILRHPGVRDKELVNVLAHYSGDLEAVPQGEVESDPDLFAKFLAELTYEDWSELPETDEEAMPLRTPYGGGALDYRDEYRELAKKIRVWFGK